MTDINAPKFTPGPWVIFADSFQSGGRALSVVPAGRDGDICSFTMPRDTQTTPEINANARLIASSPDLYEALKELMAFDSEAYGRQSDRARGLLAAKKKARAALRAAEGGKE